MTSQNTKRAKRGRRGEGTIYWDNNKNCYRGEISLGYTASGCRRRRIAYGSTKAAVRERLKELSKEYENGIESTTNYTVEQAVNDWFIRGLRTQGDTTIKRLKIYANNHVIPGLGKAKIKQLTPDDVDDWLNALKDRLSTNSLKTCLSILRRSLRLAERRNKLGRNVANLVEAPVGRKGRSSHSMTLEEAKAVMAVSKGSWIHAYLVLSLLTGIRTEEARALQWQHVHLEPTDGNPPHMEVWRSVRKGGDTKTQKSRRTLALPKPVVTVLREWQIDQREERKRQGVEWRHIKYVFGTRSDREKEARAVRVSLRYVLPKAGLPKTWVPRELRHTFVSLMSAHGASDELIADLVGHKLTTTTRMVYRHQLRPVITEGAEIIGQIFE